MPKDWNNDPPDAPWRKVLYNIIYKERANAFWNTYYDKACEFIERNLESTENIRIMEIGTAYGGQALAFTQHFPSATMVVVDPLLAGYDDGDVLSVAYVKWMNEQGLTKEEFSVGWANALMYDQMSRNKCVKYHLVKELSGSGLQAMIDAKVPPFDVIFIDGLHTYDGVVSDIKLAAQLIKPKGILIFNDYGSSVFPDSFPGVTRAVDEFVNKTKGGTFIIGDNQTPPGLSNVAFVMP
jgi:predicted O-methyltransferase YrrM